MVVLQQPCVVLVIMAITFFSAGNDIAKYCHLKPCSYPGLIELIYFLHYFKLNDEMACSTQLEQACKAVNSIHRFMHVKVMAGMDLENQQLCYLRIS